MEVTVEATMNQKCVNKNMVQTAPRSLRIGVEVEESDQGGMSWPANGGRRGKETRGFRRGLHVFLTIRKRHAREVGGIGDVGSPTCESRCGASHLTLLRV